MGLSGCAYEIEVVAALYLVHFILGAPATPMNDAFFVAVLGFAHAVSSAGSRSAEVHII